MSLVKFERVRENVRHGLVIVLLIVEHTRNKADDYGSDGGYEAEVEYNRHSRQRA